MIVRDHRGHERDRDIYMRGCLEVERDHPSLLVILRPNREPYRPFATTRPLLYHRFQARSIYVVCLFARFRTRREIPKEPLSQKMTI